jgi:hypothetical protein
VEKGFGGLEGQDEAGFNAAGKKEKMDEKYSSSIYI